VAAQEVGRRPTSQQPTITITFLAAASGACYQRYPSARRLLLQASTATLSLHPRALRQEQGVATSFVSHRQTLWEQQALHQRFLVVTTKPTMTTTAWAEGVVRPFSFAVAFRATTLVIVVALALLAKKGEEEMESSLRCDETPQPALARLLLLLLLRTLSFQLLCVGWKAADLILLGAGRKAGEFLRRLRRYRKWAVALVAPFQEALRQVLAVAVLTVLRRS
jgi:hypothetical protein